MHYAKKSLNLRLFAVILFFMSSIIPFFHAIPGIPAIETEALAPAKTEPQGIALGMLGAPASGKAFWLSQLKKHLKDLEHISPALTTEKRKMEDLTIDGIRQNVMSNPPLVQLSDFIDTFYWLRDLKNAYPQVYTHWWNEFNGHIAIWGTELQKKIHDFQFFKVTADETLQINFQEKMHTKETFLAALSPRTIKNLSFENSYHAFMYINRFNQYKNLFRALHVKKPIYFDETGADAEATLDRINQLHKNNYVVIVCIIQPEDIGINYMQNAYRIIEGSDGGRDSGNSIVWTYSKLKHKSIAQYEESTEHINGSIKSIPISVPEDFILPTTIDAFSSVTPHDDMKSGNKPIDLLVKITPAAIYPTYQRIQEQLGNILQRDRKVVTAIPDDFYQLLFITILWLQTNTYLTNASSGDLDFTSDAAETARYQTELKEGVDRLRNGVELNLEIMSTLNKLVLKAGVILDNIGKTQAEPTALKAFLSKIKRLFNTLQANIRKFNTRTPIANDKISDETIEKISSVVDKIDDRAMHHLPPQKN